MTDAKRKRIVRLYEQGKSIDAIVTITGYPFDDIRKAIHDFRWGLWRKTGRKA